MHHFFRELNSKEHRLFARNNTPQKIQTYLDSLSVNFEIEENTLQSPRRVMTSGKAQCFEGALLGAAMLWYHGYTPMVLDLVTIPGDDSHVVAVFKEGKKWGALSKTNHAVLRYRDAVYASPRELAMSYFHEYFLDSGEKKHLSPMQCFRLELFQKTGLLILTTFGILTMHSICKITK